MSSSSDNIAALSRDDNTYPPTIEEMFRLYPGLRPTHLEEEEKRSTSAATSSSSAPSTTISHSETKSDDTGSELYVESLCDEEQSRGNRIFATWWWNQGQWSQTVGQ